LVTATLSVNFLVGGLTVQHQALLRRQMRFNALAAIPVLSLSTGFLAALSGALLGWGYWSLIGMSLVANVTNLIAVWVASHWRPGPPCSRAGVREMVAFGMNLTGFNTANYFARNLDNVLIGQVC
jgi:PST family polysaccharide transporter